MTRRLTLGMTEDAHRRLRRFAADAQLSEEEALSFLFENFESVTNQENMVARLRLFVADLPERKK